MGGGLGASAGTHALIVDALLSDRMVTSPSQTLTVSATQNPDLFWGIQEGRV